MPKISQLESATDITSNDLIQVVDVEDGDMAPSGTNKKATASLLANQLVPLVTNGTIVDTKLATISTAGKVSNSATTATSANTASAIVSRDASGNFTAGTITATLNGNAGTVTNGVYTTDTGTVTSTMIVNNTIVDADVNTSAAIAGTKVSPNFGSQNIVTTGSVGIGTTSPNASCILDISSTNRGFRPPSMTTGQRDSIASPVAGVVIYNTTTNELNIYNGSAWDVVSIDTREGHIENFRGLTAAFGEFMKLEKSTKADPFYVGVTGFGDSMASGAYVNGPLIQQLMEIHGCGAWTSPNLGGRNANSSAWTFTGGATIPSSDFTFTPASNWLVMPAGSTATTSIPQTTSAILRGSSANNAMYLHPVYSFQHLPHGVRRVSVYYVKQTGGGTLQATVSQSQVSNQVLSVSANAADGMGKLEFTPVDAYKPITVTLEASVAQVRVIGVVFWGFGGVVAWSSQRGGSTMEQQLSSLTNGAFKAAYSEFFAELNTSLVLHQQRVSGDVNWQANYQTFFTAFSQLNGSRVSQLVLGEPPIGTEESLTTDEINIFLKAESAARGLAYIDQKAVLGSYQRLNELGFDITTLPSGVDSIHLGGLFYRYMAGFILDECKNFQAGLPSSTFGGWAKRDKTYQRFICEALEETIKRRFRFQSGFIPDGQLTSGTGFTVGVDNEKGVFLASGTELGHSVCRLGILSSGSASGSRANMAVATRDFTITGKGSRNLNLKAGLRAWIVFGVHTTAFTSVSAIAERCFGLEFAWGPDVGSPDSADTEVVRIFAYDGTSLVYSTWNDTSFPGSTPTSIGGLHFMIYWDFQLKRLTLASYSANSDDAPNALQPVCSLSVPNLTTSTNGAWANMGIGAYDAANVPATAGGFAIQELTCVGGQLGHPLRSFAS
jgi:hypothetical protein